MTAPRFIAQRSPIGLRVPRPGRFVRGTRTRREMDGWDSPRELRTTEGNVRDYATPGSRVARPEERARCQGTRSEERRVGKECRRRWSRSHAKKQAHVDRVAATHRKPFRE